MRSSVPAVEIETFVVGRIRAIGRDPELVAATVEASRQGLTARHRDRQAEIRDAQKALGAAHADATAQITLAGEARSRPRQDDGGGADVAALEARVARLGEELASLEALRIDPDELRAALASWDGLWASLTSAERARIVQLLIERIDYDGGAGKIAITFAPAGVRTLAVEAVAGGAQVAP